MIEDSQQLAPGAPGMSARWAPGPKSAVGTAVGNTSSVWFTIGDGILNEVYWPRVDTPSIRDMGFLVTNGHSYFSEEKSDTNSDVKWQTPGVPAFEIVNTAKNNQYKLEKQVVVDPGRDCVLQHTKFLPSDEGSYQLHVLLAPHLGNQGGGNSAWIEKRGDRTLLLARRENYALALVCSNDFLKASAGYAGSSDGWQDLNLHKNMQWQYDRADNGNVALTALIDLSQSSEFTLALGFGVDADEAATNALASLEDGFVELRQKYIEEWQAWHEAQKSHSLSDFAKNSLAVLKCHISKNPVGGIIAGLASPWGYTRGDDDPIGYHIVWVRDMVESAGGLLAAGVRDNIREIIGYLQSTQREDGHWPQNMWLDGTPFWNGVQMDETALPILLVNLARIEGAIDDKDVLDFWPMAKKAAGFLARNGPVTQQDRWEEDPGYTPFTVSAEIAALLAAAEFAELSNELSVATYLRETADNWFEALDRWMYAQGTDWAQKYGINGYYERIANVDESVISRFQNTVNVKNVPSEDTNILATHLVSPDALAFTRFGLRLADDSRMTDTVKIIDDLLKVDTPYGTTWHRYNDDGYGENADGSAFDGTGIGRGWPLLTGERAHFELALGHTQTADKLRSDMETLAGDSGLLPEQVWDSSPIPNYGLEFGRPSGSAMPLAWAHAEYLKLDRSLKDSRLFDLPPQTVQRYLKDKTISLYRAWRFNHKIHVMQAGKILRIETLAPARIHWSSDDWQTVEDDETIDSGLGVYYANLATTELPASTQVIFTFFWQHAGSWEGIDYQVLVID